MKSESGQYEIWETDVLGRPLFCLAVRASLWDINDEFERLQRTGLYGGRLQIAYPDDRSGG